VVVIG